jgi:hypothetical protein
VGTPVPRICADPPYAWHTAEANGEFLSALGTVRTGHLVLLALCIMTVLLVVTEAPSALTIVEQFLQAV